MHVLFRKGDSRRKEVWDCLLNVGEGAPCGKRIKKRLIRCLGIVEQVCGLTRREVVSRGGEGVQKGRIVGKTICDVLVKGIIEDTNSASQNHGV